MTLEEIQAANDERSSCFAVDEYPGIAWHFYGAETEPDEDTYWTGIENPTGRAVMVMVGDDRKFSIDVESVTELDDDEFCYGCGQIGCGH